MSAALGTRRDRDLVRRAGRFWSKVNKGGPVHPALGTACWLWTGADIHFGYGVFGVGRGRLFAHRFAWTWQNGGVPAGLCVLHRCDNPPCVRPDHLFLGTEADNVADMMAKGRHRVRPLRGASNGSARLTEAMVVGARTAVLAGRSVLSVAKELEVPHRTLWAACVGETWAHVSGPLAHRRHRPIGTPEALR